MRKAVIDVGSNSLLLLIEEWDGRGWNFVHEETSVTALGEGTKSTGLLSPKSVAATLDTLRRFFDTAHRFGVQDVVARATMAVRIASNAAEFIRQTRAQGTPVEILTGNEEARLGFDAVANDALFPKFPDLAIVDPGGHSTELTVSRDGHITFMKSFAVGTLGLKSSVIPSECPPPQEILAASMAIDDAIGEVEPAPELTVVVLGATGTNLVSIRERYSEWNPDRVHGAYLTFEEISRAVGWLMPLTDAQRREIVGMETGRERTLAIGALILERFLHALRTEGCFVSVKGWRYALLESGVAPEK